MELLILLTLVVYLLLVIICVDHNKKMHQIYKQMHIDIIKLEKTIDDSWKEVLKNIDKQRL